MDPRTTTPGRVLLGDPLKLAPDEIAGDHVGVYRFHACGLANLEENPATLLSHSAQLTARRVLERVVTERH